MKIKFAFMLAGVAIGTCIACSKPAPSPPIQHDPVGATASTGVSGTQPPDPTQQTLQLYAATRACGLAGTQDAIKMVSDKLDERGFKGYSAGDAYDHTVTVDQLKQEEVVLGRLSAWANGLPETKPIDACMKAAWIVAISDQYLHAHEAAVILTEPNGKLARDFVAERTIVENQRRELATPPASIFN